MKPLTVIFFVLISCLQSHPVYADKYWVYDGERQFTESELYMMKDCGTCSDHKHFNAITNPPGIEVLSDAWAQNDQCAELYFPGCQYSRAENFCMKTMSEPRNQPVLDFGTDVWLAFSVFVSANYHHQPDWDVIYQFHGAPDDVGNCDEWRTPPFAIELYDHWEIVGRYVQEKCDDGSLVKYAFDEDSPLVKGGWTHFVIHIRFDYSGNGQCRVWKKDAANQVPVKIVDFIGALGYNDDLAPYDQLALGYYYGGSADADVTLYFDRIIYGDAQENLDSMMYGVQISRPMPPLNLTILDDE